MKTITLLIATVLPCGLPAQEPFSRPNQPLPATGQAPNQASALGSLSQGPPKPPGSSHAATAVAPSLPSVVRFDRPTAEGPLWALGHDWKASFDGRGFVFMPFFGSDAPRHFPLRIELASVTVGGQQLDLNEGLPIATASTVRTPRGPLVEVVGADLRQLEQSFVFETLPNRGALVVEVSLSSELACSPMADGLMFSNELGNVVYRKAVAVDATGESLPLTIEWSGTRARIEIPAAFVERAHLPLVLDPVISSNYGLAPGNTMLQREPDVATIQGPTRSCVVWRRQYNATDVDCWAVILDANLAPLTGLIQVDYTSNSWSAPAIAASNYGQNFVVVSQVDYGTTSWIGGRRISATGSTGTQTYIEGVGTGLPGNNYRPDIGGDPYSGSNAYFTVVWEHETSPGNNDIYFKQLYQDGSNVSPLPTAVSTSTMNQSNVAISKSNATGNWFVVYQTAIPTIPASEAIVSAQVTWFGSLVAAPLYVDYPIGGVDDFFPRVSSPAFIDGGLYALVAFQKHYVSSGSNDIVCAILGPPGTVPSTINLSQVEGGGLAQNWNQILPDVDTDGVRFAVSYSEQWLGLYDYDTRVSTLAYIPSPLFGTVWRLEEERVYLGASGNDEYWTRMFADYSGGSVLNSRYVIVDTSVATNDVQAFVYGGYAPGPFFTTRPLQCGNLSIAASGTPALGNPLTFTVGNGAASGTILGLPGTIPLNALGCNCSQGVVNGLYLSNPLVWTIPPNPNYVGIVLSVQGWTVVGNQCLGFVDLSDTIDFTIR